MRNYPSRCVLAALLLLPVLILPSRLCAAQPLQITEFMADNGSTLRDEDGDYSDWVEIFNPNSTPASLNGWSLTDDPAAPAKWRFPAWAQIPAHEYLVVFASGKDRTNGFLLHTNFKLGAGGEYLGLIDPFGGPASQFTPSYPRQREDVSFGRDASDPGLLLYFPVATPGARNSTGGPGFAGEVAFGRDSAAFRIDEPFALTLTSPGAEVYYAFGTNLPGQNTFRYTGPILITNTTLVRARAFAPNLLPGPVSSRTYIALEGGAGHFTSDLPLMVLHNFGQGPVLASGEDQHVAMQCFEPGLSAALQARRASLTNAPAYAERGTFHVRGFLTAVTSTQGKSSFLLETQDEWGGNRNVALLGLPEESDWVLYAPTVYDRALLQNPLAHQLFREFAGYSSRTRFFELFLKDDTGEPGPVTMADYYGVFVLEERIKRDKNRVDVETLEPEQTTLPEITGGYILSIDETNDAPPFVAGGVTLNWEYPNGFAMTNVQRTPQANYVRNYLNDFNAALQGPDWTDPLRGYAPFIDVDSWVNYHLHTVIVFSPDTLRLSTYLHKPRNGPLKFGPGWDFDRSQGSADTRDFNPLVWSSPFGADYFNEPPWWSRLFQDPDFWQRWIDRYQQLRDGPLSLPALFAKIDALAKEVREAQPREQSRWNVLPRTGLTNSGGFVYNFGNTPDYENEVRFKKHWYASRLGFMDTQFVARPFLTSPGGHVAAGFSVAILPPEPGSSVVCTLDGTDPRPPGGGISPRAISSATPVVVNVTTNLRVVARAYNPAHRNLTGPRNPQLSSPWSAPVASTFYREVPPLRITEIMFHPQAAPAASPFDDEDFEFVELKNIGDAPLNLRGFRMTGGIEFSFPDQQLQAGEFGVVVANRDAFSARYPWNVRVLGAYTNNLANSGERLVLEGPMHEPILDFEYSDDWFPVTDGLGFSLVHKDPTASPESWGSKAFWRPSALPGAFPGAEDPPPAQPPGVVINEVWTHEDAVELLNLSDAPADISGWFLSDDFETPRKYTFPPGTILEPGECRQVPGTTFGFSMSPSGEEIYLFSAKEGILTGYAHGFDFGAIEPGLSFGRFVSATGGEQLPIQASPSPGQANTGPRIGPVVVSEIHYHPPDYVFGADTFDNSADEFIELLNLSDQVVPLHDPQNPARTWKFTDAVKFSFPAGAVLPARGFLLVVGFDAADPGPLRNFRERFSVPPEVPVYGPFDGKLDNSGERVELRRPIPPDPMVYSDPEPYSLVERIRYSENAPWPEAADGLGRSLQRVTPGSFGNDAANWMAAMPSPGRSVVASASPVILSQPTDRTLIAGNSTLLSVLADGPAPLEYQWRFSGRPIPGATNAAFLLHQARPVDAGAYDVVVMSAGSSCTSSKIVISVLAPIEIARQPETQIAEPGGEACFSVIAAGDAPLTYQWRRDGVALPGAVFPVLSITNVSPNDQGLYDVRIQSPAGATLSSAAMLALKIQPAVLSPNPPLSISAAPGEVLTFGAGLHGTFPLWVRWRVFRPVGSQILSTETLPSPGPLPLVVTQAMSFLTITVQSNSAGTYAVVLTNAAMTTQTAFTNVFLTVLPDTDGDLVPNAFEEQNGMDPGNPADANGDLDGDGAGNRAEYIAGTDPRDAGSFLRMESIKLEPFPGVEFTAAANRSYTVQYSEPRPGPEWLPLMHVLAQNTNAVRTIYDFSGVATNRFYRVVTPVMR